VAANLPRRHAAGRAQASDHFETHEGLIRNAAATTRIVSPAATRAIARSRRSFE